MACKKCEPTSYSGEITAPTLPKVDGGGAILVDTLPETGESGAIYFLVDDVSTPTEVLGEYVYQGGWVQVETGSGSTVSSVNNVLPDASGNIELEPSDIGAQKSLTAGANITIDSDGEISATDTTYNDFTGTDGTAAGAAGLVPAPAVADAGKFLKADGTWSTASASITPVQTTGTSTTDVMSQDAATKMLFPDISNASNGKIIIDPSGTSTYTPGGTDGDRGIIIGSGNAGSSAGGFNCSPIIIGQESRAYNGIVIGHNIQQSMSNTVVIGNPTFRNVSSVTIGEEGVRIGNNRYALGGSSVAVGYNAMAGAQNISRSVAIGHLSNASAAKATAIGEGASAPYEGAVAIGQGASANGIGSVAIGINSSNGVNGTVHVGTSNSTYGYNRNSNYRKITGVYDGDSAHDAATFGQLQNAIINGGTTAPTTATVGAVGTLYSYVDTTGNDPEPHLMVCTAVTPGVDPNPTTYTWTDLLAGVATILHAINNGGN